MSLVSELRDLGKATITPAYKGFVQLRQPVQFQAYTLAALVEPARVDDGKYMLLFGSYDEGDENAVLRAQLLGHAVYAETFHGMPAGQIGPAIALFLHMGKWVIEGTDGRESDITKTISAYLRCRESRPVDELVRRLETYPVFWVLSQLFDTEAIAQRAQEQTFTGYTPDPFGSDPEDGDIYALC